MVVVMGSGNVYANGKMTCEDLSKCAAMIMYMRQTDTPIYEQYSIIDSMETDPNDVIKKLLKNIVLAAYDVPSYQTEYEKKQAINEFSNQVFIQCQNKIKDNK